MKRFVFIPYAVAPVLVLQCVLAQASSAAGRSGGAVQQDATNDLFVTAGHSVLLDCAQPVQRVAIGAPTVAEATVISPSEIMVNGKGAGQTTLILWESGGSREFFNVTVRANSSNAADLLDGVRRELRSELPGQAVKVTSDNGAVFLSGTVKDLTSSQRAVQIASTGGKVVNLLNVEVPDAQPQILLKVVFASVDRTRSKQLGINLFSTGFGNTVDSISTQQFSPPALSSTATATASLSNELNLFAFSPGLNLGATVQALQSDGLVQVLAEPNVLAEDGKLGSFLAGGEYPYPVVQGSSGTTGPTVTVMFKEYGVRLNFIPTITPRGTIRLQVAPEVSSLDFANAVTIGGFQVPAIDVRKVKTEVELSEGQSFAIGGLLDNRESQTFEKVPFIGSVPILGKFFQSITKTKSNTELIVIVTPEIVQPTAKGQTIATPKFPEGFLPPNSTTAMHTPEDASGQSSKPAPTSVPIEKLLESMKPETPLPTDNSGYSTGSSSTGSAPSGPQ